VSLNRVFLFATPVCCVVLAPSLVSAREYRSLEVKHEFQRQHPCPSTGRTTGACPGYVKDHVKPLACRGPDSVANLQWQTTAAAKAKDRWERKGYRR
jgi:hypothetical protein